MTKKEIIDLVNKVHSLKKDATTTLPDNSYFLDKDTILCYPRQYGDSRYPYYCGGLIMFPHSSGYIDCNIGAMNVFKNCQFTEDTPVAFFAGEKTDDGYFPYSITGAARQLTEKGVERYLIYTSVCAYYITETENAIYALRLYMDRDAHMRFSACVINRGESRTVYLSSIFEPMLTDAQFESFFSRMSRYGYHYENGSYLLCRRAKGGIFNCLAFNKKTEGKVVDEYFTTSKSDFLGLKGACITNAVSLKNGKFAKQLTATNTTDLAIASDIVYFELEKDGYVSLNYDVLFTEDRNQAEKFIGNDIDLAAEDESLKAYIPQEKAAFDKMKITFNDWHNDGLNADVINKFLRCVQRQVSLCALGDNYAGRMLGIRDVFQQLEASLMWQKDESRAQIVRVMNFILEDGRPPRQITFPTKAIPIPDMDLRPFIDQGFWIISTIHTYLSYTDDFSILDEECGYYKALATRGPLENSNQRDSILEHLIRIADFLVSNVDEKTGCIHALFGDWNDALDALGKTSDPNKEYGDGVSVMATLQLYLALEHICDILKHTGKYTERIADFKATRARVEKGLLENAVHTNDKNVKRIVHGWGENQSYFVGSYNDFDGKSRLSLTANSFYAISNLVKAHPEFKEDIVNNLLSLDSKHGMMTFSPEFKYFSPEVGRISGITKGTAENACAYIHASTFAIMALFLMGHSKEAWEQLQKSMVISHENVTLTTFVMPNSYCYNEEFFFDGDSMGDWYTGSGAVLIKELVKNGFGIMPNMDSVIIMPPRYMPCNSAKLSLEIKGADVTVEYHNKFIGKREIYLNGKPLDLSFDDITDTFFAVLTKEMLGCNAEISIVD